MLTLTKKDRGFYSAAIGYNMQTTRIGIED